MRKTLIGGGFDNRRQPEHRRRLARAIERFANDPDDLALLCVAASKVLVTRIDQPESPSIPTVARFAATATGLVVDGERDSPNLLGTSDRGTLGTVEVDERRRLIVEMLAQHLVVVVAVGESVPFRYFPIA